MTSESDLTLDPPWLLILYVQIREYVSAGTSEMLSADSRALPVRCMHMFICLYMLVDISIMGICYASDIIEYVRRISELSNAALCITQDTDSIEK